MSLVERAGYGRLAWNTPEPLVVEGLDATRICRNLWIGSVPLDRDAVGRAGFRLLLLCALSGEYRYCFQTDDFLAGFRGVTVQHVPLDDAEPTDDEVRRALEASKVVARAVQHGDRTLCTCMQGRNRSGLIVAMALHRLTGRDGAWCVREVQRLRENALTNPGFVRVLKQIPGRP